MTEPEVEWLPDLQAKCSAEIGGMTGRDFRTKFGESFECRRIAKYRIDDRFYCKLHAGEYLLRLFAKKEKK